jgi:endonuclease/exonuclease/phosphatase family metal-dependent hydrolase
VLRPRRFFCLALPLVAVAALACTGNAKFQTGVPYEDDCGCAGAAAGGAAGTAGSQGGAAGATAGAAGTPTSGSAGAAGGPSAGSAGCAGCAGGAGGTGGAGSSGTSGSAGGTGGAPIGGINLRIANFNVENMLDTEGGGPGPGDPPPTLAAYLQDVEDTASLLNMLSADVILLEEVENRDVVLNDLADKLGEKRGIPYSSRWLIRGNDGIRNIALISTLPIASEDVISHDDVFDANGNSPPQGGQTFTFARNCLEVTVRHYGYPVTLFGVHYKAKSNDDPARRLAEARRTRKLVDARFAVDPNARLVVLGDFNDTPGSPPMNALTTPLPPLSSGVSLLPPDQAWTHPFGTPNQIIDDQNVSPSLALARVRESITVWHDYDTGFPENLREVSDHSPVAITYHLGDAPLPP